MKLVHNPQGSPATNKLDNSMIPAINIVFLLLIFFMIAGQITARSDQLQLPKSNSESELTPQVIEIRLMADGQHILNGNPIMPAQLFEQVKQLQLSADIAVTLRVHKDLPASALDPVLKSVRQFGIQRLQLATER